MTGSRERRSGHALAGDRGQTRPDASGTPRRARAAGMLALAASLLATLGAPLSLPGPAAAQEGDTAEVAAAPAEEAGRAPRLAMDTASLASGPGSEMEMLLEKSIFDVNVLRLRVRFGPETAARIGELAEGRDYSDALADSLAAVVLEARGMWARVRFLRGFGYDRFLEGTRENLEKAREAGIFDSETFERVSARLPEWYGFLEGRGIREGDVMRFRVRGDTIRTRFTAADGETLADRTDVDALQRLSVPARYFAPGTDFREGLIRSLFGEEQE